jgi:hypothetical protein
MIALAAKSATRQKNEKGGNEMKGVVGFRMPGFQAQNREIFGIYVDQLFSPV